MPEVFNPSSWPRERDDGRKFLLHGGKLPAVKLQACKLRHIADIPRIRGFLLFGYGGGFFRALFRRVARKQVQFLKLYVVHNIRARWS